MTNPTPNDVLTIEIAGAIQNMLDEKGIDPSNFDWTQFFLAYIQAGAYLYNSVSGDDANTYDFTLMANRLAVQHLLEQGVKPQ